MLKIYFRNTDHNCLTGYFLNLELITGKRARPVTLAISDLGKLNVNLWSQGIRDFEKHVHFFYFL